LFWFPSESGYRSRRGRSLPEPQEANALKQRDAARRAVAPFKKQAA